MKHGWIVILGVCALVYSNSLENGFHYDDEHSILNNLHLRDLTNIPTFFQDPATFSRDTDKGMYRPLLLVTYALNFAFATWSSSDGYDVFGYHVVNLLLHGFNACLVWLVAGSMLRRRDVALLAGLLFALHPLTTEPVNYISSRSESLAGLFFLLGVFSFIKAEQLAKRGWAVLAWVVFGLGLLSKSTVITLPAVLLVYDFLFLSRRDWSRLGRKWLRRHVPFWGIAFFYLVLIWTNGFLSGSVSAPVRDGWTQFLTQTKAFVFYLRLLLWPMGLNVEHQFFEQRSLEGAVILGALALMVSCLGGLIYLFCRRRDTYLFLALWGIIVLLPVMVMPLNILVNERRLYLPCAAFCICLSLALRSEWAKGKAIAGFELGKSVALVILVGYGMLSYSRNQAWETNFSLWEDAVRKAPYMPRGHLYLGNTHKDAAYTTSDKQKKGQHWLAATEEYRRTTELDPNGDLGLRALNNLGAVHFELGDIEAAEIVYRRAVEINPQYADALTNLGSIYHEKARGNSDQEKGRILLTQAIGYYRRTLSLLPNHPLAYANMGLAYFDLGDWERARQAYERAYFLDPRNDKVLNNMGNLYATVGSRHSGEKGRQFLLKARHYYQEAIRINPANPSPRHGWRYVEGLLNPEQ